MIGGRPFATALARMPQAKSPTTSKAATTRFTAWVGGITPQTILKAQKASIVFQVFGDSKKLFNSGVMRIGDPAKQVSVPLVGIEELKLVVTDAGDGISWDHADWAEAMLIGGKPGRQRSLEVKDEVSGQTLTHRGLGWLGMHRQLPRRRAQAACRYAHGRNWAAVNPPADFRYKEPRRLRFTRKLTDAQGDAAMVTECFSPDGHGVRWKFEISSQGDPGQLRSLPGGLRRPRDQALLDCLGIAGLLRAESHPRTPTLVQSCKASVSGASAIRWCRWAS